MREKRERERSSVSRVCMRERECVQYVCKCTMLQQKAKKLGRQQLPTKSLRPLLQKSQQKLNELFLQPQM